MQIFKGHNSQIPWVEIYIIAADAGYWFMYSCENG